MTSVPVSCMFLPSFFPAKLKSKSRHKDVATKNGQDKESEGKVQDEGKDFENKGKNKNKSQGQGQGQFKDETPQGKGRQACRCKGCCNSPLRTSPSDCS